MDAKSWIGISRGQIALEPDRPRVFIMSWRKIWGPYFDTTPIHLKIIVGLWFFQTSQFPLYFADLAIIERDWFFYFDLSDLCSQMRLACWLKRLLLDITVAYINDLILFLWRWFPIPPTDSIFTVNFEETVLVNRNCRYLSTFFLFLWDLDCLLTLIYFLGIVFQSPSYAVFTFGSLDFRRSLRQKCLKCWYLIPLFPLRTLLF